MLDKAKWTIISLFVIGTLYLNYYFYSESVAYRVPGIILMAILCLVVAFSTKRGKVAWQFVKDSKMELYKVVWPTKQETVQSAIIVMIMVIVMSLLLWIFDSILFKLIAWITGQGV
tara:strand:- start:1081 stop:1428 length:348 start_codon:yes stop_codon:yes gene_type:complete